MTSATHYTQFAHSGLVPGESPTVAAATVGVRYFCADQTTDLHLFDYIPQGSVVSVPWPTLNVQLRQGTLRLAVGFYSRIMHPTEAYL